MLFIKIKYFALLYEFISHVIHMIHILHELLTSETGKVQKLSKPYWIFIILTEELLNIFNIS